MSRQKFKIDLGKAAVKLDVATKQSLTTKALGSYRSVFKGRGLEFAEYRNYTPGEDASLIDWKASARSTDLLIKQYVEERNLNVFFLIDVSESMIFGSTDKLKNEYAAELVAALAHSVLESGDNVGFAMFNDAIEMKSQPLSGPQQYYLLTKALVNPEYYGGRYNLVGAIDFLITFLKDTSLVIIVSDFLGLKGNWEDKLKVLASKADVIAMAIRDPRDMRLPSNVGQVIVEDPYTGVQNMIDPDKIKSLYSRVALKQLSNVKKTFLKNNCDFVDFYTDQPYVKRLISFFKVRSMKIS